MEEGDKSNRDRSWSEKFSILLEAQRVGEDQKGAWLRENGLHSEHLTVWEQEVREYRAKGEVKLREELRETKKELKRREKELARKEKALAEMAALLTLQTHLSSCGGKPRTKDRAGETGAGM